MLFWLPSSELCGRHAFVSKHLSMVACVAMHHKRLWQSTCFCRHGQPTPCLLSRCRCGYKILVCIGTYLATSAHWNNTFVVLQVTTTWAVGCRKQVRLTSYHLYPAAYLLSSLLSIHQVISAVSNHCSHWPAAYCCSVSVCAGNFEHSGTDLLSMFLWIVALLCIHYIMAVQSVLR